MTEGYLMRAGFRTVGYRQYPLDAAFDAIAQHGYSAVEVCLEHPQCRPEQLTAARVRRICNMAHEKNLPVSAISYHGDNDPPPVRQQNQRRILQLGTEFTTDVVVLNASPQDQKHPQQQWEAFRDRLQGLLAIAADNGVNIALEPEPGHFLHSSADMMKLIEQMDDSNLKVNLDVGHAFLTDADVTESIRQLDEHIMHTHIEGMPEGEHRHLPVGKGDLDLAAVIRALEDIHYDGFYTIDLFDIADDPDRAAQQSMRGLRRLSGRIADG